MKTKIIYTHILILVGAIVLSSCSKKQSELHSDDDEHEHVDKLADDVHLVQNQMEAMQIKLDTFRQVNLSTTVKASGQLELPPQNKASVSPVLGGRVKTIHVVSGDLVRKGQVLAKLEHPDFISMQEEYLQTSHELNYLEKDYNRQLELQKAKANSRKVLEEAEFKYKSKQAKLGGLKAKLQLLNVNINELEKGTIASDIQILSPINGYVRLIETNVGKYMPPQQEMFEIVDNDHIHVDLRVFEKDMHLVRKGQKVIFSLPNQPDRIFEGSIFAVGKAFEKDPKAMIVHAEITKGNDDVLPGMYVDARIITNDATVRALPEEAVVSDGGLDYIFVLKPGGNRGHQAPGSSDQKEFIFKKIEVNIGKKDIGFCEVIPVYNLPAHTQIVTKGSFYLLAEMKKGEGGHHHH